MKQIELNVAIQFEGEITTDAVRIIEARIHDFLQAKGILVKNLNALVVDGPKEVLEGGKLPNVRAQINATGPSDYASFVRSLRDIADDIEDARLVHRSGGMRINTVNGELQINGNLSLAKPSN